MGRLFRPVVGAAAALIVASSASAGFVVTYEDDDGLLRAEAAFALEDGGNTLTIRFRNISTGVPGGFEASDQILTGISWDFAPGGPGGVEITGGTVLIGPSSESLNFDTGSYGPGTDVSGEWGYGNMDGTGLMENFVTATISKATPFGGPNLDGPVNIDGPQGGLVADPLPIPLGGLGAIQDEVLITLSLSDVLLNLDFLADFGSRVEFGSNAAFITVPAPGTIALLAVVGLAGRGRRRD